MVLVVAEGMEWGTRHLQLLLPFPTGMGCWAREVLVPEGPLYRVTGTAVSISCNVTGYEGPAQQNFEWFLYRPEAPDTALGIVSTKDTQFSYAIFKSRVVAGEVQVQRLQGDAVVLKIARLQAQDAGIYECHTPSTDTRYLGSYSGKVELRGTGPWDGVGPHTLSRQKVKATSDLSNCPLGFVAKELEAQRG